jgi:hypothetical protein
MRVYNEFFKDENHDFLYTNEDIIHAIATKQITDIDGFFKNYVHYFDRSLEIFDYKNIELFWKR